MSPAAAATFSLLPTWLIRLIAAEPPRPARYTISVPVHLSSQMRAHMEQLITAQRLQAIARNRA
jgi:hypothetical protein